LVFAEDAQGNCGVGEAWCDSGDVASVTAILQKDLTPKAIGKRFDQPEKLWADLFRLEVMSVKGSALYAALSAMDTAIWDLYARHLGQPLYRLLGGHKDSVYVYGSSGLYAEGYGPKDLAKDMSDAMESGCCGVKIKVAGASVEEDEERVAAVRGAIGKDARLMVDALFRPNVPEAKKLGRALQPHDLFFYEAPTNRRDVEGWVDIRKDTSLPLSGPEVESGLNCFRRFLELQAVDYLQADVTICGGITETRRIAALSTAWYKPLTMHASGSVVAFAVNAQTAAAFEAGDSVEYHLLHQALFDKLWEAGWQIKDGHVHLPDAPGLGIDLRPDDPVFEK